MNPTVSFTTLTDEEEKELYRLNLFYWQEAQRCEETKACLAGCVMLGSALETMLILMINLYADEAEQTGDVPKVKGIAKPLLKWDLIELIRVAKAAQWLPSALNLNDPWRGRRAQIGDYAEVVRMVRNLAHPARYLADHYRKKVTRTYLRRQFEIVLQCRDWLVEHNDNALLAHLKATGGP